MSEFVPWLHKLAKQGGKGVVDNIDARCLGRIADELTRLRKENTKLRDALAPFACLGRGELRPGDFNRARRALTPPNAEKNP